MNQDLWSDDPESPDTDKVADLVNETNSEIDPDKDDDKEHLDHFNDFKEDPRYDHWSPKKQHGSPSVDKSVENSEKINILSIQTTECEQMPEKIE